MDLFIITSLLLLWNILVINHISKWFYTFFKRYNNLPAEYIGRKVVHILGGGFTAFLVPVFFEGYYEIVAILAFLLALYVAIRRKWKRMYWFQVKDNAYEVNFAIAYGVLILVGVLLDDIWVGLLPILLMSFGDAVTGLVRAFTQRQRVKSWDGTIAMFITSTSIAFWRLGPYGILIAALVSLIEKIPGIDDNITIPLVAAACTYLKQFF